MDEPVAAGRGEEDVYCPTCGASFAPAFDRCPSDGSALIRWRSQRDDLVGVTLDGRFMIEAPLGAGGMALVYRGLQLSIGRPVAIKVVREHLSDDPAMAKRFFREARMLTSLNHPNIVSIYDFGQSTRGALYLVMELLRGATLEAELARTGPFAVRRACAVAIQLCDALAAAHALGLVHRDLKPANVMLLDSPVMHDLVKVLDFGLARSFASDRPTPRLTAAGMMVGTPRYMAPESIASAGAIADARSDMYSLGCVLYELLTGAATFDDGDLAIVLARHVQDVPPRLPAHVPVPVARIVTSLLAKDPGRRLNSTLVRAYLRAFLEQGARSFVLSEAAADIEDTEDQDTLLGGEYAPVPAPAAYRPTLRVVPAASPTPVGSRARIPKPPILLPTTAIASTARRADQPTQPTQLVPRASASVNVMLVLAVIALVVLSLAVVAQLA